MGVYDMWKLILKADVEFFDKEMVKTQIDTLGFYDWASNKIYLNPWGIFHHLKIQSKRYGPNFPTERKDDVIFDESSNVSIRRKKVKGKSRTFVRPLTPKIRESKVINHILEVINHESFHAGVQSGIEDKLEDYIREIDKVIHYKFTDKEREFFKFALLGTVGMIWQEVGVRIHQEGMPAWKAITFVVGQSGEYRNKLKDNFRELKFLSKDNELLSLIIEDVEELTVSSIKHMTNGLNLKIKQAIKNIGDTDAI